MTKKELVEALKDIPDDTPVLLETEDVEDSPFTVKLRRVEYPRDFNLVGKSVVLCQH